MLDKFAQKYVEEANEIIAKLEELILAVENDIDNKEIINEIFRLMHTLKGGGAMFGFNYVSDVTHELESIYDIIRKTDAKITKELLDVSLDIIDYIKLIIQENITPPEDEHKRKVKELSKLKEKFTSNIKNGKKDKKKSLKTDSNQKQKNKEQDKKQKQEKEQEKPKQKQKPEKDKKETKKDFIEKKPENKKIKYSSEIISSEELQNFNKQNKSVKTYRIFFKPHIDILKIGTDPLLLIRELSELGLIKTFPIYDNVPSLDKIKYNDIYLCWIILLVTDNRNAIDDVFIFIEDESIIDIETITEGNAFDDKEFVENIDNFIKSELSKFRDKYGDKKSMPYKDPFSEEEEEEEEITDKESQIKQTKTKEKKDTLKQQETSETKKTEHKKTTKTEDSKKQTPEKKQDYQKKEKSVDDISNLKDRNELLKEKLEELEKVTKEQQEKEKKQNQKKEEVEKIEVDTIDKESYAKNEEKEEDFEDSNDLDNSDDFENDKIDDLKQKTKKQKSFDKHVNKGTTISSLRVSSEKVDTLMNLVSELITTQARLSVYTESRTEPELESIAENIQKLSRQLRDNAFDLSMVPLQSVVIRFQRLVRDLSAQLNKDVDFRTDGTSTELDKRIIENLIDPILHLIRNSLDHGIESKQERIKLEKKSKAIIFLNAFYSGTNVYIQVGDDGRGLDIDEIKQKALKNKLLPNKANIRKEDILNVIFEPGFSTSKNVSELSGRGVGLDVVKRKVSELRGEIKVDTKKNKGTVFTIKLPLTLSIIDGLLVNIGSTRYVVPMNVVYKIYAIDHKELEKSHYNLLVLDKKQIPYYYLRKEFEVESEVPDKEQVLVINHEDKLVGIVVDKVIGEYQAVIKTLGRLYNEQQIFSGATILGDGTVALVMDVRKIVDSFNLK